MNCFAKTFDIILIGLSALLLFANLIAKTPEVCQISYENMKIKENLFKSNLIFSISGKWKLSQTPKITVISSRNVKKCEFGDKIEKISPKKYQMRCYAETATHSEGSIKLSIKAPVCGGDICAMMSKELTITYDRNQPCKNSNESIAIIMLFAFIGGFILNFMPCVLPVVLMKLRAFAFADGKKAVWATIAGNYASFFAFALFISFIKAGGERIGWGMHFQNTNFLKAVAIVLFLLSLYSVEIIGFAPSVRIDSAVSNKRGVFLENFISSVIASIIAIPCVAPFLGTAATFAMQSSFSEMALIFFLIATGFSMPYVYILHAPIFIPLKIGRYSVVAKTASSCGVFVTLAWILYLLTGHIGAGGVAAYAALFIISAILFAKKLNAPAVVCLVLSLFIPEGKNAAVIANQTDEHGIWTIKEDKDIEKIINGDATKRRIVIFNISADWCLTCKYNKLNVLNDKRIIELIKRKNILCLEGDMSKKNDFLMKFITDHGRVGIPFMIVFGPNAKNGVLLSETPSVAELAEAIRKAE